MQKEKRKQSEDEADDSSLRKRRKADLTKPVSFISTDSKFREPLVAKVRRRARSAAGEAG
ncbi:hypothetical protein SADUNF_Sadunf19G0019800 [Salix dunnii]|uniref:Uncharacterized protein n=1 Tax=Salix dunnii TaxID=1413687 RepID=A0A835J0Q0_9ROSI|nr:hypothetical protein SADUNF_Sadunf19G0019800 [Salix dunnii]